MFDPLPLAWHTAFWASDPNWSNPGDGNAVGSWSDASGNGRTASQGTGSKKPIYHAADLGGRPCVTFDGVDDFMQTASFTAIGQPATLVVIAQLLATSAPNIVTDGIATSNRMIAFDGGTGGWTLYQGTTQAAGTVDTNAHIALASFAAGSVDSLRLDGTAIISGVNAGTQAATGLTLGGRFDGTANFANARIGFVGLVDRALSTDERINLDSWAQQFYGITVSDYRGSLVHNDRRIRRNTLLRR